MIKRLLDGYVPIRTKITGISVVASVVALVLAAGALVLYDRLAFKDDLVRDMRVTADIAGANCAAAISFGDQKAAHEVLEANKAETGYLVCAVYDKQGHLFSSYVKAGRAELQPPPYSSPAGTRIVDGRPQVFRDILVGPDKVGSIYIEADMSQWEDRTQRFGGVVALLVGIACLVAFLLASRLQRLITEPLTALVTTMRASRLRTTSRCER